MTQESLVIPNLVIVDKVATPKLKTCFFTKSVKFGFGELSICRICAESRDLDPEHGFRAQQIESSVRPSLTDLVTKQGRARFCNLIGQVFATWSGTFLQPDPARLGPRLSDFGCFGRFSLLQTLCARRPEKRTHQA